MHRLTLLDLKNLVEGPVLEIYRAAITIEKYNQRKVNVLNKYFEEVDDFHRKVLLGGLKSSGEYSENALAKFYEDFFDIKIENPYLLARLIAEDRRLQARVVGGESTSLILFAKYCRKLSQIILAKLQYDVQGLQPFEVSDPEDLVDVVYRLLSSAIALTPNTNEKSS